jgi:hypothetical protein
MQRTAQAGFYRGGVACYGVSIGVKYAGEVEVYWRCPIKNIIALAYFVGGYFYEIGSDLTKNPVIALLAQLGGGKGKVTRRYSLEGLKKLLIHKSVERFIEEQEVGEVTLAEMMAFVT